MSTYNDAHRLFLQLMLQRRSVDEAEAVRLMKSCCEDFSERPPQLDVFLQQINKELEAMDLSVRNTVEERKERDFNCVVLVNQKSGPATRELSTYSKSELSFIRLLVAEVVMSEVGELMLNAAINLGLRLNPQLKASACEKLIEKLEEDKWLFMYDTDDGGQCVSLSGLIVTELNNYLVETLSDDNFQCFFCTKVTIKGYRCKECKVTVHRDCVRKYWESSRKQDICPGDKCSAILLPPTATTSSDAGAAPKKRRRVVVKEKDSEEEYEPEQEDEVEKVKVENRRSSLRRRTAVRVTEDEDED